MKKLTIGIVVVLLVIAGIFVYSKVSNESPTAAPVTIEGADSTAATRDHFTTVDGRDRLEDYSDQYKQGLTEEVTSGAFADATTTVFAVTNPFAATSTAEVMVYGQNGTTSIDLFVGTSTTSYAPTNGNLETPSLVNATVIATSTKFYVSSGITKGPGTGYNSSGSGTLIKIVVGPSERVLGHATSSYAASSATGLEGITNSNNALTGRYIVKWTRFE